MVIGALALIGGLAAITFTKVVGVAFLGEPRTQRPTMAHRPGWLMVAPLLILAIAVPLVGLAAPRIVAVCVPIAAEVALLDPAAARLTVLTTSPARCHRSCGRRPVCIVIAMGLALLRRALLAGRKVEHAGTWDCGYARPTPRMQYSASSFVQPATTFFAPFLRTRQSLTAPSGLFPQQATFRTETPDLSTTAIYFPIVRGDRPGRRAVALAPAREN